MKSLLGGAAKKAAESAVSSTAQKLGKVAAEMGGQIKETLEEAPKQEDMALAQKRREEREQAIARLSTVPGLLLREKVAWLEQMQPFLQEAKKVRVAVMPPEVASSLWACVGEEPFRDMGTDFLISEKAIGFEENLITGFANALNKVSPIGDIVEAPKSEMMIFMLTPTGVPFMQMNTTRGAKDDTLCCFLLCCFCCDGAVCCPCCRGNKADMEVLDPESQRVIGTIRPIQDCSYEGQCGCLKEWLECLGRRVLCCSCDGWDVRNSEGVRRFRVQDGWPCLNLCGIGNCLSNVCTPNCCCAYKQEVIRGEQPWPTIGCPWTGGYIANPSPASVCTGNCCDNGIRGRAFLNADNYMVKFPPGASIDDRLLLIATAFMSFTHSAKSWIV
mmetsp:Transcript_32668/g.74666  ORF Transcript_32668/g.74666 Transcript_32668/m.74666 type:complete len:387 (-) Transcript_32668:7-1167(-)